MLARGEDCTFYVKWEKIVQGWEGFFREHSKRRRGEASPLLSYRSVGRQEGDIFSAIVD